VKIFSPFFLIAVFALASPAHAQDAAKGEIVFKKCIVCHAVGDNARNKTGPQLNGVFGRKAGSVVGYSYSPANTSSGVVWDENNFSTYIKNPAGFMPGTKMAFAGLSNEQDIKDLIAYLKQFPKP
jgi:cytochrome c